MSIFHNFYHMNSRATFSLNQQYLGELKEIAEKNKVKSLSGLINDILGNFLESYQKGQKLKQMQKNYQKYSRQFNSSKFSALEEGLLSDLNLK